MHESPRRRRTPAPWIWAAVGIIVVTVLAVSTLRFMTVACAAASPGAWTAPTQAAPPLAGPVRGLAYFYNPASGEGNCSLGPLPADGSYISLAAPQYAAGSACGSYLDVTGPDGSVIAEVVDLCPGCTNGGVDLSEAAFARVADPSAGTALVSYRLVRDPRLPGPVELRVAPSATAAWLALQVINHGNPLASVEVAPAAGAPAGRRWLPLTLSPDDYWVASAGAGPGPFQVRITDIYGHQVVAGGIRLAPGLVQRGSAFMYTLAAAAGPSTASPPVSPSAVPTNTASPAAVHADDARRPPAARPHC